MCSFLSKKGTIAAALIPKISGGTFRQGLNVYHPSSANLGQGIADKLLFIMAVAAGLFGLCALALALIDNDLAQLAEVSQVLNLIGRIAARHA